MANRTQVPSLTLTAEQVAEYERLYPGDLHRGYSDGLLQAPHPPGTASPAYSHGRQCAVIDLSQGKRGDLGKRDVMTPPWVWDALNSGPLLGDE